MSLPIDDTIDILRGHVSDPKLLQAIAADLVKTEKEVKATRSNGPKAKTRLVALVRGDAALQAALAGGCYLLSVPDDETTATYSADSLLSRLRKAVTDHNDIAPKGRRKKPRKIETWNDAFTTLKPKTIKASGSSIGIKQKGRPCEVVVLTEETVQPKP